jgi:hypothetical protein
MKGKSLLQVAALLPVLVEHARSFKHSEQLGPEKSPGQPPNQGRNIRLLGLRGIGAGLNTNHLTKGQSSPLSWAWAIETIKSTVNMAK